MRRLSVTTTAALAKADLISKCQEISRRPCISAYKGRAISMAKVRSPLQSRAAAAPEATKAILSEGPVPDAPVRDGHLIVGIGASAGGLDAFQAFFSEMPTDSGMAFVLVQHLDPDYKSALAEIVGEWTAMPVVRAIDGTVAAPNTVTVIAQNAILKIEGGVLRVALPQSPTARRSAVDTFLLSLAEDQGENAVGIILSGFGSDGTIGIEAIKEGGGLTLCEATFDHRAKFGMPQSATAAGFVDYVLQPQEMPARLLQYRDFKCKAIPGLPEEARTDTASQLGTICAVLNSRLGRDFGQYKPSTLMRRVRRRMQVLNIVDLGEYIAQLRLLPNEPELLFRDILISVTQFFRDPALYTALAENVLPDLISGGGVDEPIRVWIAGCATGEETYSLAILFKEALSQSDKSSRRVTIFATDINDRAIAVARAGLYSNTIEADITVDRLGRNFVKEGNYYRVAKDIRDMCVFSTHDLVKDPPFSKLDMVSCRNLLIYFKSSLQQRVISTFHYGLKANGLLWLGPSETVAAGKRLFRSLDRRSRIFRRLDVAPAIPPSLPRRRPAASPAQPNVAADTIDAEASQLMARFAPAYIVFDRQHEIQRFSGPVAKFIEPVSGGASLNLFRMLHAELRSPVRNLVRKALAEQTSFQEHVTFEVAGQANTINLIAEPMTEQIGGQRCLLLAFQEVIPESPSIDVKDHGSPAAVAGPEHGELIAARERLQTITEELETANEELQSSNEEFQSVNEELHSTVEELESSKEELQSINEELQTVNSELSNRADSLVRSNSDLANLFDSTSIATLFLDIGFHIRRFTPAIMDIFNIREGDEGRLISDFSSRLAGSELTQDIAKVLRDLGTLEREAQSTDGLGTYLVRVKPYRDLNNVIDGVVVTLIDISERKRLERDRAHLAAIVASSEDAIMSHDLEGIITSWNGGAEKIYGYTASEMIGQPMSTLLDDAQINEWADNLALLRRGGAVTDIDTSRVTKDNQVIYVSLNISPVRDAQGIIIGASAVARDISKRKVAEEHTEMLMAELDHRVKNILAVISSVVTQTLKVGGTAEAAGAEIEGRIQAIARAHGLLTGHGGVGGSLGVLVATELTPYEHRANVTISGEEVVLTSRANLSLALAIHELATNSAKYGALSTEKGHLDVTWHVSQGNGTPDLEIIWLESGGPRVAPPTRRGYGSRLIEQSLVRGLTAKVHREFLETGVRCHISVPLTEDIGRVRSADHANRASG